MTPAVQQSNTNLPIFAELSGAPTVLGQKLVKSSGGNLSDRFNSAEISMMTSTNKRKETGITDSDDTGTVSRIDTRSPARSNKDGSLGFASANLINAKLEQIQSHGAPLLNT